MGCTTTTNPLHFHTNPTEEMSSTRCLAGANDTSVLGVPTTNNWTPPDTYTLCWIAVAFSFFTVAFILSCLLRKPSTTKIVELEDVVIQNRIMDSLSKNPEFRTVAVIPIH